MEYRKVVERGKEDVVENKWEQQKKEAPYLEDEEPVMVQINTSPFK
jgi:hypothetical protein